jgi:hypothetical protein
VPDHFHLNTIVIFLFLILFYLCLCTYSCINFMKLRHSAYFLIKLTIDLHTL